MDDNEKFEAFAERFRKHFGYLLAGKDDRCPPNDHIVLFDLTHTFSELESERAAHEKDASQIVSLKENIGALIDDIQQMRVAESSMVEQLRIQKMADVEIKQLRAELLDAQRIARILAESLDRRNTHVISGIEDVVKTALSYKRGE